jgi:hypothetical protein
MAAAAMVVAAAAVVSCEPCNTMESQCNAMQYNAMQWNTPEYGWLAGVYLLYSAWNDNNGYCTVLY